MRNSENPSDETTDGHLVTAQRPGEARKLRESWECLKPACTSSAIATTKLTQDISLFCSDWHNNDEGKQLTHSDFNPVKFRSVVRHDTLQYVTVTFSSSFLFFLLLCSPFAVRFPFCFLKHGYDFIIDLIRRVCTHSLILFFFFFSFN